MPNAITSTGLTTATRAELLATLYAGFLSIYGVDLSSADSSNPDVQAINLFVQAVLDNEDLLTQIYNGMDPDQAVGVVLDQRCALNGIQRQAGTYTITNVTITVTEALSLTGLDIDPINPYTVADNAGNQWQLVETQNPSIAGVFVYAFQAKNTGAVLTTPNTITVPVSVVLGVSAINNPTTYTVLGINEETDAALRLRRQLSVSLASQGYLKSLLAALENVNGVNSAFVHENTTGIVDSQGVPGHSIWVIIDGVASDTDIANAIYTKRNAGCGQKTGTTNSFNVLQVDGTYFTVYWDVTTTEDLYIKLHLQSLDGINAPNTAAITNATTGVPALFTPGVNAEVNINQLSTLIQTIDPNTLVVPTVGDGFADNGGGPFTNTLTPSAASKKFTVSSAHINLTVI